MTKQEALDIITRNQEKSDNPLYRLIQKPRPLLDKRVWFCIIYCGSGINNFEEEKRIVQDLLKSKEVTIRGRPASLLIGYGKYLGMFDFGNLKQYILYDITVTHGTEKDITLRPFVVLHEGWIKLGEWVSQFEKERVVFT